MAPAGSNFSIRHRRARVPRATRRAALFLTASATCFLPRRPLASATCVDSPAWPRPCTPACLLAHRECICVAARLLVVWSARGVAVRLVGACRRRTSRRRLRWGWTGRCGKGACITRVGNLPQRARHPPPSSHARCGDVGAQAWTRRTAQPTGQCLSCCLGRAACACACACVCVHVCARGFARYAWAEDKEHCEEYGRMLQANPAKVSSRAKKRGLPQLGTLGPPPRPAPPCLPPDSPPPGCTTHCTAALRRAELHGLGMDRDHGRHPQPASTFPQCRLHPSNHVSAHCDD